MTAAGRSTREGATIGAVLAQLRPEFPDVTISKIRFLEAEGLVSPERTPSGYRRFTEADVERLRFVLAAQRDHYLPLKVIKQQLDRGGARDRPPPAPIGVSVPGQRGDVAEPGMTRDELARRTGVDRDLLAELEQFGLLGPGPAGLYDADAARVATLASAMAGYGIEPRHLRAFRAAADRELALLEQVLAPLYRQRDPSARERADEVSRDLAELSVGLHTLLVKSGLRRVTGR